MTKWTWAAASCRGTSHEKDASPKDDHFSCFQVNEYFVAIVCDGAGSALRGGAGAAIVCRFFSNKLRARLKELDQLPSDEMFEDWIDEIRDKIATVGRSHNINMREFSATLVLLISNATETVSIHIGDGASVLQLADTKDLVTLSWPFQGEYASTTVFITDQKLGRIRIVRTNVPINAIAVFSDGLERIALDFKIGIAHAPFFRGMFAPLKEEIQLGHSVRLSAYLGRFLQSQEVNNRTDDDKTMILACIK